MTITFHDVQIDIEADSPEEAYNMLCDIFKECKPEKENRLWWACESWSMSGDLLKSTDLFNERFNSRC